MALRSATLLGSSSGRNAGDAALISGLMQAVDSEVGEPVLYEVPTVRPAYVRDHYAGSRTRPISMMPWSLSLKMLGVPTYRSLMRTDLTLIFDAILFDRSLYNPLFNYMSTLALLLPRARRQGKRMAFYNVGAGPVPTQRGREMLRELAELMDFITVRDQASYDILREIGVKNPRMLVGADAALNVRASDDQTAERILEGLGLAADAEILAINVNAYMDTWAGSGIKPMGREKFVETYAAALRRVDRELGVPILFVCTQHMDVGITRQIMQRMPGVRQLALLTNVENDHYDVKAALRRVSLLFGMRLHAMILASSEGTPIIGIAYQPKVDHYFANVGLPECSMSFEAFSEDALVAHVLQGWAERDSLRSRLADRVPKLKAGARKAAELVGAIHRDEDLDTAFARLTDAPS